LRNDLQEQKHDAPPEELQFKRHGEFLSAAET
jgi:hypothetical protein